MRYLNNLYIFLIGYTGAFLFLAKRKKRERDVFLVVIMAVCLFSDISIENRAASATLNVWRHDCVKNQLRDH